MIDKLREQLTELELEKRSINDRIRNAENSLKEELIKKYGFFTSALIEAPIGGTNRTQKYIIRGFELGMNDYVAEPCMDLMAYVLELNKENKINRKKVINDPKFISRFKVIGRYDFVKDKIVDLK